MVAGSARDRGKTPSEPLGSEAAAGLGVTPAEKGEAKPMYKYEKAWRLTRCGGLTIYIAICNTCGERVEPTRERRSKGGTHGTDYYVHEHPLSFILLMQSNSGVRTCDFIGEVPEQLFDIVKDYWLYLGASVSDIEEVIDKWFNVKDYMNDPGFDPYDFPSEPEPPELPEPDYDIDWGESA
jgi:hypothetical protein